MSIYYNIDVVFSVYVEYIYYLLSLCMLNVFGTYSPCIVCMVCLVCMVPVPGWKVSVINIQCWEFSRPCALRVPGGFCIGIGQPGSFCIEINFAWG